LIRGFNIFGGQKLAKTCCFVGGRIIVKQEKFSRAERSWTNPLNALREAIHCSFKKFCIYSFFHWCEFFLHYSLRVEKSYQHGLDAGPLEFQFLRPIGYFTNPFRTLSPCFRVTDKTPGLISRNNFVKKNFVRIGPRDNVLARRDSIFPLLRCQGVWNKTFPQLYLSRVLFQNPKNYCLGDVQSFVIILDVIRRSIFFYHFSNSSNFYLSSCRFCTATSLVIF
jgi:hypothetical protein